MLLCTLLSSTLSHSTFKLSALVLIHQASSCNYCTFSDFQDSTFETLDKDIQEVLNELLGDEKFEKFRVEYEKVAKALQKSNENEKRLMSKCRELNAEIMSNTVKVSTAMKLADEDQATINSLKMVH